MWCSSCHDFIISSSVPFAAVTSNFMSGTWTFLSVTPFSYYNTLNLSVTERKVHVPDMKFDVTAAKGTEEEMMKSWQEEHHMQVVLLRISFFLKIFFWIWKEIILGIEIFLWNTM